GEGGVAGDGEDRRQGAAAALTAEVLEHLAAALGQRELGELGVHGLGCRDPVQETGRGGDDLERRTREVALAVGPGEQGLVADAVELQLGGLAGELLVVGALDSLTAEGEGEEPGDVGEERTGGITTETLELVARVDGVGDDDAVGGLDGTPRLAEVLHRLAG